MEEPVALDECYRCGYDLRGIADDQACPECGLLAQRSRRESDELHLTRPGWLKRLSLGVWTILLGLATFSVGLAIQQELQAKLYSIVVRFGLSASQLDVLDRVLPLVLLVIPFAMLLTGCWLLTTPEGYPPADYADRRRRRIVRITALLPAIAAVLKQLLPIAFFQISSRGIRTEHEWTTYLRFVKYDQGAFVVCIVVLAFMPLPLFLQLRNLARRARSAQLAEHCMIVGIGTTLAIVYISFVCALKSFQRELGLGIYWESRSTSWIVFLLIAGVMAGLLILWSLYLLIRFAIAFGIASRSLHSTWRRDDRSLPAHLDH